MMLEALFGSNWIIQHSEDPQELLTVEEMDQIQRAQLHGVQNCKNPYNNCLGNYIPYQTTQRPLDERFADFKVRLADALKNRGIL